MSFLIIINKFDYMVCGIECAFSIAPEIGQLIKHKSMFKRASTVTILGLICLLF